YLTASRRVIRIRSIGRGHRASSTEEVRPVKPVRLTLAVAAALALTGRAAAQDVVFGLTAAGNSLVTFPAAAPGVLLGPAVPISGLQANESVLGMDIRPANGRLYGVTNQNRIYTLNATTGAAALVSTLSTAT